MKKLLLFSAILLVSTAGISQKDYEDQYLGWIKIYHFKGAAKPLQVDEKNYSIAQLSLIDSFANWMQASYTPKGGLGDIIKYVTPKKNLYHEKYNAAVPHSYGANARTYIFLKKVNGKWTPENNLGYGWTITANEIPLDYRLGDLNTDKVCLFTIPGYDEQVIREQPNSEEAKRKKMYDLSGHPVLSKYILYNIPGYNNTFRMNKVILSNNNKSPFLNVTIGEALQAAEDALPVKLAEEKKIIAEKYPSSPRDRDFFTNQLIEKFDKAKATLRQTREKYNNRLNENAYTKYGGYSITDLGNGSDMFTGRKVNEGGEFDRSFPILKVDPGMQALCKTDRPQWVVVSWYGDEMNNPVFKHMHESIIHNFDFDYLYQFLFEPEKVRGKPYKTLRSPVFEEKVMAVEKSDAARKMETDPSVTYFEDFSNTPPGKPPVNWTAGNNSDAQKVSVEKLSGENENWAVIKGHTMKPNNFKKTFPQDFTVSFDVAVPKGFTWGAKALEFWIADEKADGKKGASIQLRLRPGFDGRDGSAQLNTESPAGKSFNDAEAYQFSNDKPVNRVSVTIKRSGDQLQLLLNNKKLIDKPNLVPAGTGFNQFWFYHIGSNGDTEKYYITNIKITRD